MSLEVVKGGSYECTVTCLEVSFAGIVAAVYVAVTVLLESFGHSWIQMRISEALTCTIYLRSVTPCIFDLPLFATFDS